MVDIAKPAHGPASKTLFVGGVPPLPGAAWDDSSVEVEIVDADPDRLQTSTSIIRGAGVSRVRATRADPGDLVVDWNALSVEWESRAPFSFDEAWQFVADATRLAQIHPIVADGSCAIVYCCVLNECRDDSGRMRALQESFRVLRRGGIARFYVDLTDEGKSGSALLTEGALSIALCRCRLCGIQIVGRDDSPLSTSDGTKRAHT